MGDFRILGVPELLSLPDPLPLIEGHIAQGEVGCLYGQPNKGKTFLALDWALCIATGTPWLGKYATKQGPVLFLAGEGAPGLKKRVEGWMAFHGFKADDVPVYFICRAFDLKDSDNVEDVRAMLEHYHDEATSEMGLAPILVVVDTLSQYFGGGEENGPDMATFVQSCRYLSQEEDCSVLIVHHTNKGGISERGHTALRGNTDVMFSCEGHEEVVGDKFLLTELRVQNDKQKDNPKEKPLALTLARCQRTLVIEGQKNPTKCQDSAMALTSETLVNLLLDFGNSEDVDLEIVPKTVWFSRSPLATRTFYNNVHKLLELKLIKGGGRGVYKFTPLGRETFLHYQKLSASPRHIPKVAHTTNSGGDPFS